MPTDKGLLKAWIEADKVSPERATCAASLRYDGAASSPTPSSLPDLEALLSSQCLDPNNVIIILAPVPEEATESEILRANERVAFVRNLLFVPKVDPRNITTTFVRTNNVGVAAAVTVQVFRR